MKLLPTSIGVIVAAAATTVVYVAVQPKTTGTNTSNSPVVYNTNAVAPDVTTNSNATTLTNEPVAQVARYTDYSPEKLTEALSQGATVLYFHADWCPICRPLDLSIKAHLNDLPAGLTILKVNYDRETNLKKQYGVTYQHTFVQVDATGKKIKLWSGTSDALDIKENLLPSSLPTT